MDTATSSPTSASSTSAGATRAPSTLSVARTIVIFAVAYAVVDVALGVLPVNLMLRRFMGATMPRVWLVSLVRLVLGMIMGAAGCGLALRVSGRTGGRLTSTTARGIMSIGAITAGAIAGALDVGVHRLLVWRMIHLAQRTQLGAELVSALLTVAGAAIVTAILIVPRTRVVRADAASTGAASADSLDSAELPA